MIEALLYRWALRLWGRVITAGDERVICCPLCGTIHRERQE